MLSLLPKNFQEGRIELILKPHLTWWIKDILFYKKTRCKTMKGGKYWKNKNIYSYLLERYIKKSNESDYL